MYFSCIHLDSIYTFDKTTDLYEEKLIESINYLSKQPDLTDDIFIAYIKTAEFFLARGNIDQSLYYMDKAFAVAGNLVSNITSIGIKLIAVTVVLQILFGAAVPFLGLDVITNITKIVASLGSQGLVGLVAVAVLYWSFNKA